MFKSLIFFSVLANLSFSVFSQTKTTLNPAVIINRGSNVLYTGGNQFIILETPGNDSARLVVELSQGDSKIIDNADRFLNIGILKPGSLLVKVFIKEGNLKRNVGQKRFSVMERPLSVAEKKYNALSPAPVITFCGKEKGLVLTDSVKIVKRLYLSEPYKLKSSVVYFGCNDIMTATLTSEDLEPLFQLFKRCGEGVCVTFSQVKITKGNITYDAPDMSFIVKDKL